jgi:hypothetical protein
MKNQREYLVALDVRSTLHAWIAATGEDDAIKAAEEIYAENESAFTAKGGAIESILVLECQPATAKPRKRFRVAFEQPVVHAIVVEADNLDEAIAEAEKLYADERGFFTFEPPGEWHRVFNDWDLVEAEEVQP